MKPVSVELAPGEIRALAALSERYPTARARLQEIRQLDDLGYVKASFSERTSDWPFEHVTSYLVSPTGRTWRLDDNGNRGGLVREADHDQSRA